MYFTEIVCIKKCFQVLFEVYYNSHIFTLQALQKVRSTGNMGNIMIKLAYSNPTVQHIVNFLYSGKISVPQSGVFNGAIVYFIIGIPVR